MKLRIDPEKEKKYDHAAIEKKWQAVWEKKKIYQAKKSAGNKFYSLIEFPYPSGDGLHVGHIRSNTAMDIISRKRRREGFNVLYPVGWDAFGLPTENYAIKTGIQPSIVTKKNTDTFRRQLKSLGFSFDWSREINTTDPRYYKWTQWIFLQFLKAGLAYKKKMTINWCPKDMIGLANEEVIDGRCERCGTPVEKREREQWMLAITKYADKLLEGLDATDYGSDYVMPKFVDKANPHQPGKPVVRRRVVHAIVFDPKADKYLIIRNKKFGWDTVVIGGVENGEDIVTAARREVREETGYTDLDFKRILGGPTEAHYYAKHKGENRIAIAQAVYFELKSGAHETRAPIDDVDDKDKSNEILWIDSGDFVPGKMVNSELPIWLARMSVRVDYDRKNPGAPAVPCFTQITEDSAFKEGAPIAERQAVAAIVKHWSEDKYIGLKWKKVPWRTIITGGPEGSQTPEEGAATEIIEETGYLHPRLVRKLGPADARFFHVPKKVNRFAHFDVMYFELADGERRELTEEESANHDVVWLSREEMSDFITPASQKYIWDTLFLGKPSWFTGEPRPLLDWPESIKESQRNWIGRSEGAEIDFTLDFKKNPRDNERRGPDGKPAHLTVFTTRPDTLFGVTYLVLAPEHLWVKLATDNDHDVLDNKAEVAAYIQSVRAKSDIERTALGKEKTGIELKGVKARNPATGEEIPLYVADYVLADYGTGAVMAVPAHDERDFEFAKKYKLPCTSVILKDKGVVESNLEKAYQEQGWLHASGEFSGQFNEEAKPKITDKFGRRVTTYKLRDWVFSRQRYWGEPIPVIHCEKCGVVPVPEKDLPVKLPPVKNYKPTETGESPLAAISKWVNVKCPQCSGKAKRETDTMPNWAGSSWYYLRYTDPKNAKAFASPEALKYWTPVDWYNGGNEHTTLHLLYSRFWHRFLYDQGLVPTPEPYRKRTSHGLILAKGGEKMSKSKGNVVNPDGIVAAAGADSLRLYEMFMGPFEQAIAWDENGIVGTRRFIEKVWKLAEKAEKIEKVEKISEKNIEKGSDVSKTEILINKTVKKVGEDIEAMRFNTAVSALMIAVNELEKTAAVSRGHYEIILRLLAPFAPHVTEELWHNLGYASGGKISIHGTPWPAYDPAKIADKNVRIAVQVNGKTRASFETDAADDEAVIRGKALALDEIKNKVYNKDIKKIIYVKGRLINIVID